MNQTILRIFLLLAYISLSACGGSGGGGGGTISQNPSNPGGKVAPPEPVICPANQVNVNGICQCPNELVASSTDVCTDQYASVEVGAEFLEAGYPLLLEFFGGSYYGPFYLTVGNIDTDPELELIYKSGSSAIWAWNHDGSFIDGWPTLDAPSHSKITLAQLDNTPQLEVLAGHEDCAIYAYDSSATPLIGWPAFCGYSITRALVAGDMDDDGIDEMIYDENLSSLWLLKNDASQHDITPPERGVHHFRQDWCGSAIADLNGNGSNEIIAVTCAYTDTTPSPDDSVFDLHAIDINGVDLPGFPITLRSGRMFFPVIGDVDGDGVLEIIVASIGTRDQVASGTVRSSIKIVSNAGVIENEINMSEWIGDNAFSFFELADLDGDSFPEILFMSETSFTDGTYKVHAHKGDGTPLTGWPVDGGKYFAIGDIDGDDKPEVVTAIKYPTIYLFDNRNVLTIYDGTGQKKDIDVVIDYMGRSPLAVMPAIADIDLDGRNEVIIVGDYVGSAGVFPQIWAFDFGGDNHGEIEWGQMFSDERNSGKYLPH